MLVIDKESRYHRQELISWWDQQIVSEAKVLVIGAGALGNEILKTLALIGAGNILIYDIDAIESSNLSRCILFRESDTGKNKAVVAAERIMEINPDIKAVGYPDNILYAAGLGVFDWADIVIGAVDNRLARMFINQACARVQCAWVDGAIEGFSGIVRVFHPAQTACYECTMNDVDRSIIEERISCARLARNHIAHGRTPTSAVMASIIGALQVQESIKMVHKQPTLLGEGLFIDGMWGEHSRIQYQRKDDCLGHEQSGTLNALDASVHDLTINQLLDRAESLFGPGAAIDLSRDVIVRLECWQCHTVQHCGKVLGSVSESEAICPDCGAHCSLDFISSITRENELDTSMTLADIGVPMFDSISMRKGLESQKAWLFDQDAHSVLGALAH